MGILTNYRWVFYKENNIAVALWFQGALLTTNGE